MSLESTDISWRGCRELGKAIGNNLILCPELLVGYGKVRLKSRLGRESSVMLIV